MARKFLQEDEVLADFLNSITEMDSFTDRLKSYQSLLDNDNLSMGSYDRNPVEFESPSLSILQPRTEAFTAGDSLSSVSPRNIMNRHTTSSALTSKSPETQGIDFDLAKEIEAPKEKFQMSDSAMNQLSTGLMAGSKLFGANSDKYDYDPDQAVKQEAWSSIKMGVGQALGPVGGLVASASEFGKAVGGDFLGSIADPISSPLEVMSNSDATSGEKALSLIPGVGGLIAKKVRQRTIYKQQTEAGKKRFDESQKGIRQDYSESKHKEQMEALRHLRERQLGYK